MGTLLSMRNLRSQRNLTQEASGNLFGLRSDFHKFKSKSVRFVKQISIFSIRISLTIFFINKGLNIFLFTEEVPHGGSGQISLSCSLQVLPKDVHHQLRLLFARKSFTSRVHFRLALNIEPINTLNSI